MKAIQDKMLAAVYHGVGNITVEYVDKPVLPVGGLLMKVNKCTICSTDYKLLNTDNPRIKPPIIIGHEFVGIVVETDPKILEFKIGDRVTISPTISCGRCELCYKGTANLCENKVCISIDFPGAMAEYLAIPSLAVKRGNVLKIPGNLPDDAACLSEPLGCAVNAQLISGVGLGKTVVIIGAGPLGCLHAELARASGASRIFVIDNVESRINMARKMSIDGVINASTDDPVSEVMKLTDKKGADVVIITAPSAKVQGESLSMVKKSGVINLFASLSKDEPNILINSRLIHYNQISVTGASDSSPYHQKIALDLISLGKINHESIITHRFPLQELYKGFETMNGKECLKVVIDI